MITEITADYIKDGINKKFKIKYKYNGILNVIDDCWGQENYYKILNKLIDHQCDKTMPYQRVVYKKGIS